MDLGKLDDSERASAAFNIGLAATVLASMVKKEKENAPGDRDVELEAIIRANFSDNDLVPRFRKGNESIAEALKAERVRNAEVGGATEDVIDGESQVGEFLFSEDGENREGRELFED